MDTAAPPGGQQAVIVRRAVVAVVAFMVALLALVGPARADSDDNANGRSSSQSAVSDEGKFLQLANQERQKVGAPPLAIDDSLTNIARWWSANMAYAGSLFHNYQLPSEVSANWLKLGENVGRGGTVRALHQAFVNSPSHYENLIDNAYSYVGIGVVYDQDGAIYVAFDFMQLMPPPQPAATAPDQQRTVVMDRQVPHPTTPATAAPTTVPLPVAATAPAPPSAPSRARNTAPSVSARASALSAVQAVMGELHAVDVGNRPRNDRKTVKIAKAPSTWSRPKDSAPPQERPKDAQQMAKAWMPPSYCRPTNWIESLRQC